MDTLQKSGFRSYFSVCAALSLLASISSGEEPAATPRKPIILVPPFENQAKQRESINYEVEVGVSLKRYVRIFQVDRFAHAPRTLLENALSNIEGVTIIERQRLDTLLVESEFGRMTGIVDSEKAIKLGKQLGANMIVVGTITSLSDEIKRLDGYGVQTESHVVTCQMRFRLLETDTSKVAFSKVVSGSKTYSSSTFNETKSSDRYYAAIEAAIASITEDKAFRDALLGKKTSAEAGDGMIEVEFAPKPDNCDIEIDVKYIGGSPLKRRLKVGTAYKIRISKSGFKDWTGTVSPEAGLRITRELEPNS